MKEPSKLDAGQESNEVELSAYDLFAMSPPVAETPASPDEEARAGLQTETAAESETVAAAKAVTTEDPVQAPPDRAPRARRIPMAALALTIGAAAVAAAAVAVISPREDSPEPVQIAAAPSPAPIVEDSAPAEIEGPPVRFKNPFDESEVFEFPPGTSREEARAAVADLLILRAQERQAMIEAKSKQRR